MSDPNELRIYIVFRRDLPEMTRAKGEVQWVQCPACSEPDMRRENGVIHCTNEACPSYGGSIQMTVEAKKMAGDVNPRKVFYLALEVDNLDGSSSVEWDGSKGFEGETGAVEYAMEVSEEHGSEFIICECVPVKRVTRPKPKVETLKVKK